MSEMIEALAAARPRAEDADKLSLFGQFVGTWDAEISRFGRDGTAPDQRHAEEWRFGWAARSKTC
jgi:hypothetical protein